MLSPQVEETGRTGDPVGGSVAGGSQILHVIGQFLCTVFLLHKLGLFAALKQVFFLPLTKVNDSLLSLQPPEDNGTVGVGTGAGVGTGVGDDEGASVEMQRSQAAGQCMRRGSNLHCLLLLRASSQDLNLLKPTLIIPSRSSQIYAVGLELMVGACVGDTEGCLEGASVGNTVGTDDGENDGIPDG